MRLLSSARSGRFGAGGGSACTASGWKGGRGERRSLAWSWVWVVAFGVRLVFFFYHLRNISRACGGFGMPAGQAGVIPRFQQGSVQAQLRKGTAGPQCQISPGFPSSLQVQRGKWTSSLRACLAAPVPAVSAGPEGEVRTGRAWSRSQPRSAGSCRFPAIFTSSPSAAVALSQAWAGWHCQGNSVFWFLCLPSPTGSAVGPSLRLFSTHGRP